ncbi:uncharacterized protein Nmag_2125 [Natrialba magadii ATCC 43099]|uniref:Uncharacterized protein n=1 Tax=Natrialba magadii (strain ATCC 43099 / DSM 3394 / CCM 3739 / CIP 104546 / IAM 13178 / JCM 8861 / NBRC 102185 / NCIMB 2190 / MS3) TaxID=547559 RepID=D3SW33_NATMM|nr:hypothetical protein [Natrialba magadii]ADD05694.1 uncharacterized protein Nmag_2125 [Natrialba magadii ATCC 43099]ELY29895.1 hypothetical protein C500_09794 [Natrialba magadii ATCC 43099]
MSESHHSTSSPRERAYIASGLISAVIAVYYLPIVFGPVAGYFGFRLYSDRAEPTGVAIVLLGILGMLLGFFNIVIPSTLGIEIGGRLGN